MTARRIFVALEGVDAVGKNTQTQRLAQFFRDMGRTVEAFSFPVYDTVTGQLIRGFLKGQWSVKQSDLPFDVTAQLFQCCQALNRLESTPDGLWGPDDGRVYIADRYSASAYAFGMAAGLDETRLVSMHRHLPQPDLNILIDIPIDESFRRRPQRRDMHETDAALLQRARDAYMHVFTTYGDGYVIVDGMGSIDDVSRRIIDVVRRVIAV